MKYSVEIRTEAIKHLKGMETDMPFSTMLSIYFLASLSLEEKGSIVPTYIHNYLKGAVDLPDILLLVADLVENKYLREIKKNGPPSLTEVIKFFVENDSPYLTEEEKRKEATTFYHHRQQSGWELPGKLRIKDWQASARLWIEGDRYKVRERAKRKGYS